MRGRFLPRWQPQLFSMQWSLQPLQWWIRLCWLCYWVLSRRRIMSRYRWFPSHVLFYLSLNNTYKKGQELAKIWCWNDVLFFTECGPFCSLCNSTGSCTECVAGFYLDDNHNCSACSDHCSLCKSETECYDCVTGYYRDTGSCLGKYHFCNMDCFICLWSILRQRLL